MSKMEACVEREKKVSAGWIQVVKVSKMWTFGYFCFLPVFRQEDNSGKRQIIHKTHGNIVGVKSLTGSWDDSVELGCLEVRSP